MNNLAKASIVINAQNNASLLRRALWAIATSPPSIPYEVIVADHGSTEDLTKELRNFSCRFFWKLIRAASGSVDAASHASGDKIFTMGPEVIVFGDAFNEMLGALPPEGDHEVFSTVYNLPQELLDVIDAYGSNISQGMVDYCAKWPLISQSLSFADRHYFLLTNRSSIGRKCKEIYTKAISLYQHHPLSNETPKYNETEEVICSIG